MIGRFGKSLAIAAAAMVAVFIAFIYFTDRGNCVSDSIAVSWPMAPKTHCD